MYTWALGGLQVAGARIRSHTLLYKLHAAAGAESVVLRQQKNLAFLRRLRFALAGIGHGLAGEHSLRIQAAAFAAVLIALAILRPAPVWWALVLLSSGAVTAAELLNTAIERLADHLHPEVHPEIRIVKDCAAAAVLVSTAGALGVAVALIIALARGR